MKNKTLILMAVCASFFVTINSAEAKFGFLKRGFEHCTGVCDQSDICEYTPEKDKKFRWCVESCSHKIDVKGMCETAGFPFEARPFLPYEQFSGDLNTNSITPVSFLGLDMEFIKQTTDRKGVLGIAKRLLLVHEQYVNGNNIQNLSQEKREVLAEKLLRKFLKNKSMASTQYGAAKTLTDDTIAALFEDLKRQILSKVNEAK